MLNKRKKHWDVGAEVNVINEGYSYQVGQNRLVQYGCVLRTYNPYRVIASGTSLPSPSDVGVANGYGNDTIIRSISHPQFLFFIFSGFLEEHTPKCPTCGQRVEKSLGGAE